MERQEEAGKFIYTDSDIVGKIHSTEPKCCLKLDWSLLQKHHIHQGKEPSGFNTTLCWIYARVKAGLFGFLFFF